MSALQKRGRRRLVGAIALVLLAVIVLPMVFDPEPKPNAQLVNIRIPSEEGSAFAPKAVQKPAAPSVPAQAAKSVSAAAAPVATPELTPVAQAATNASTKPVAKPDEPHEQLASVAAKPAAKAPEAPKAAKGTGAKAAEPRPHERATPAEGELLVYQVGAFASPEKVKEILDQLKAAKVQHFTEAVATAKGRVTRVRLGPFATRQAADRALERARALGLNPVNVAPK